MGDIETWKISLDRNLWGFSERSKGSWNTSITGDHLAFYVTSPVKKIIGFGMIETKFIDETKVWPDEIKFGIALWKYRFKFRKIYSLDNWDQGISVPPRIMLNTGRKVVDWRTFMKLVSKAETTWQQDLGNKMKFAANASYRHIVSK